MVRPSVRIHLDATACQAYGMCKDEADELIDLDDWGYAATVARELADEEIPFAEDAVSICPAKALRLLHS